jgi:hypothetical protein
MWWKAVTFRRVPERRREPSYAWALRIARDDPRLSPGGKLGLRFARELAENRREIRQNNLKNRGEYVRRIGISGIASYESMSRNRVERLISSAYYEVFGDWFIPPRTAHDRLKRESMKPELRRRVCAWPQCQNVAPAGARSDWRYCSKRCYMRVRRAQT